MTQDNTARRLAEMTDEGAFERLAMAILRQADDRFRSLSHPGVNAEGKTVKSPVDGIAFVPGAIPPQIIAVHHTICAAKDLQKKWLHDPTVVKPRGKSRMPTAPAGDVVKTMGIVAEERKRTPEVEATLVLTTNHEPSENLVRDVHAVGSVAGIAIDIWARSRLVDVLDNEPRGQWLRRQFLGIDQIQLSEEMLRESSKRNLELYTPPDRCEAWVKRALDRAIEDVYEEKIVFVVGESGCGKSVACYKRLFDNMSTGGFSLFLDDEVIGLSLSLENAVERTLEQLHPTLAAGSGSAAFRLSMPSRRLLIAVEDINRSGRGAALIEKIARWENDKTNKDGVASWQLLCPVWPQVMSSLSDDARRRINNRAVVGAVFSAEEGTEAVQLRRSLDGRPATRLQAASISEALGHDPLLIALHNPAAAPDTSQTIGQFIEASLQRLAAAKGEFSAAEYGRALSELTKSMLLDRQMEPDWIDLLAWSALAGHAAALRHIVRQGDVARLVGVSTAEKLAFRHDRVREWLLARAAFDLMRANAMPVDIAAEPYFAEILGLALASQDVSAGDVSMIAAQNPLALFCSVPHFRNLQSPNQVTIFGALETCISQAAVSGPRNRHLRWEAMRALAEAENSNVRLLVNRLNDNSWNALRARYRNGDLRGGIGLCLQIEPGLSVVGHEAFLDHVKTRLGANLLSALSALLNAVQLDEQLRIGALRLAGHIGDPALANAIRVCWHNHADRDNNLVEYLWACAECVDNDPATLLGPVCDAWAALPDTNEKEGAPSPRDSLAAYSLRFAFQSRLPDTAVRYFIERASDPELKWPITYMLHGVDQPDAVEFVVRELALVDEKLKGTNSLSAFSISAKDEWERRQESTGCAMSDVSRRRLLGIWQDISSGMHLRKQAFRIWTSTRSPRDIEILRGVKSTDLLAKNAVWQRLRWGDHEAIPLMLAELLRDDNPYWWQLGRYIWSDELTKALDQALERRGAVLSEVGSEEIHGFDSDSLISEMVIRLPTIEAEALLHKHWHQICSCRYYVIAALYVATPGLQERSADAIKSAPEPREFLKHISLRFGIRIRDHPGIFRVEQILSILPYLDILASMEIYDLWEVCNKNQWLCIRRTHLDHRLPSNMPGWVYLDDKRVMDAFDGFLAKDYPFIERWLDEFLTTGANIDDIMILLRKWLCEKCSIEALKIACSAVFYIGERRHLGLLRAARIEPIELASAIIADTEFGVKRRTLGM